jgi:hypothetical protein
MSYFQVAFGVVIAIIAAVALGSVLGQDHDQDWFL